MDLEEIMNMGLGTDEELIHQPVAIYKDASLQEVDEPRVGYVRGFEGGVIKGRHSILIIETPHHSVLHSGRFYIRRANEEDLKRLEEYELEGEVE